MTEAYPDIRTERLILHPIDLAEAERSIERRPTAADHWAEDYPFDGDVTGMRIMRYATAQHGEQRPFGHYRIDRAADGLAIGGIGFKGRPRDGSVDIGYGLSPSARGHGYAAEALIALLRFAADHGVTRVTADTTEDNPASRRTLERAGFRRTGTKLDMIFYEVRLTAGGGPDQR